MSDSFLLELSGLPLPQMYVHTCVYVRAYVYVGVYVWL